MELFKEEYTIFPTTYNEILQRVRSIDPVKYGSTRNYINGAMTYLSPYISRGIISTKFILEEVLKKGYKANQIEKFIQELAWRDYWQQVWINKKNLINNDLKHTQKSVSNHSISKVIVEAKTGIIAIDNAVNELYKTGYMHNHLRMYIASLSCNIAQCHWKFPAQWMYYHLLDADWGSNSLNWQWVAGTNSNKKYFANQNNINRFCFTDQKETFLDVPYEDFSAFEIPEVLKKFDSISLKTPLPKQIHLEIDSALPSCIYNFYNLDPLWKKNDSVNRILLLEPSHFESYPISQKTIDFIIKLSKDNINNIQIYVGEFNALVSEHKLKSIFFKEHPLNTHYKGTEDARDWMFEVNGYSPSFFSYWKKCEKQLR
jgi:deoxyribodipyrimidine photo-lyase